MPIVSAKCTNCGSSLNVDNTKDAAICEYCGSAFIVEKAIYNYNVTNNISNNISGSVVNIHGGNSADFVIRAGTLEKYTGASTTVVIPNSVTIIGSDAFDGCSALTSVTIPASVNKIGYSAFQDCSGLTSITIPSSVKSICGSAFFGCSGLKSINIPNGVTSIEPETFYGCSGLTSITIPNGVTSIERCAFWKCSGLTSIVIPDSVTEIAYSSFVFCTSLVTVHASKKFIDMYWNRFEHASFFSEYKAVEEKLDEQRREERFRREREERNKSACYLTTACMAYQSVAFDDNCHELTILRSFRDTYLKSNHPDDIETYYNTAPAIVEMINDAIEAPAIWAEVYGGLVVPSVDYIEAGKLEAAYQHYKDYSLMLAKKYLS